MNKLDYTKMRSTKEEESQKFNFNSAVKELLAGKKISGKDGVLAPLVTDLTHPFHNKLPFQSVFALL